MIKVEEKIKRYISYFRELLETIRNAKFSKFQTEFSKILYIILIDTISKTTSISNQTNRQRFVNFINQFSNWKNSTKVSIPHLIKLLDLNPKQENNTLREYCIKQINNWSIVGKIPLDKDAEYDEIKLLWQKKIHGPFENINIEYLQHVHLMYNYRNCLLHEFRELGYGIEFESDESPYYHFMINRKTNINSWELVYPTKFFDKLCENSLKNLEKYLHENKLDPYKNYYFGSFWLEKLNL